MKTYILTGGVIHPANIHIKPTPDDLIIAADSGLNNAHLLDLSVKTVVGDYDSLGHVPEVPSDVEVITVPTEKDVTDTQLAVELAIQRGATDIHIIGGLGGAVSEVLSEKCPTKIKRVGINDTYGSSGKALEVAACIGGVSSVCV